MEKDHGEPFLNIELQCLESEQGPGMGGAMLDMVACGEYESVKAACASTVHVASTVRPEPELAAKYEMCYQQFKKIYPACQGIVRGICKGVKPMKIYSVFDPEFKPYGQVVDGMGETVQEIFGRF